MTTYKFDQPIGRGGMAEVFLALQESIGGFEKLVVIKRIFEHFATADRFVDMFLNEARLAATIRHRNCVEIFDIVKDERGLYIAMEYIAGETLASMHDTLRARDAGPIPYAIACRICADIAAGLDAAHTITDADGDSKPIVHRDVTPSNLLVTYNGVTKILDFGIARAEAELTEEDARKLHGKPGYLTPEQLHERPVDARADLFQLGVVLHETLTGQRLFHAKNARMTMMAVLEKPIPPPSAIIDTIPKELDDIVLGALARDRDERVESAHALHEQLATFLRTLGNPDHGDVASWIKSEFPDRQEKRIKLERQVIRELRGESDSGRGSGEVPAIDPALQDEFSSDMRSATDSRRSITVLEIPPSSASLRSIPLQTGAPVRTPRRVAIAAALAASAVALVIAWIAWPSDRDDDTKSDAPASSTIDGAAVVAVPDRPPTTATNRVATPVPDTGAADAAPLVGAGPADAGPRAGAVNAAKNGRIRRKQSPVRSTDKGKSGDTGDGPRDKPATDFKDPWSQERK